MDSGIDPLKLLFCKFLFYLNNKQNYLFINYYQIYYLTLFK